MSDYRQCPFDPLHKIAAKNFALHLVKCKRQHPDVKLVSCHFDTSHLVKEEELREHMKTCSGRKDLLQYKTTVNRVVGSASRLQEPAVELIYNTARPRNQAATGGNTLQDDSECWDDFTYKAYDPLENCKSKLQNDKAFIIPTANRFAGQMQAATALKENQADIVPDGSLETEDASTEENLTQRKVRQYDRTDVGGGSSSHRSVANQKPYEYESESGGYGSSSGKQHKDRFFGESSSSRQCELQGETRHRNKSKERSYRNRDRSRSDSTSGSDRKSHGYDGYFDGNTYHGSYDTSRSRQRRDRYEAEGNSRHRVGYDRYADSDSSDRSYNSSKHKVQPHQRYM